MKSIGRDFADCLFAVPFSPEIRCHHAKNIWAVLEKNYTGVVAHALELAVFVGYFEVFGQVARNPRILFRAEELEEVAGQGFIQHLASINSVQQCHHLARSRNIFAALAGGF